MQCDVMRCHGMQCVQYIKNAEAKRTKTIKPLIEKAGRAVLLSGTPAVGRVRCLRRLMSVVLQLNRPNELYTQVDALRPGLFPSAHQFAARCTNTTQHDGLCDT